MAAAVVKQKASITTVREQRNEQLKIGSAKGLKQPI
jgi:hypothetical protein